MARSTNEFINRFHRFVISTHTRPDGDAIGSQLALGRLLTSLGKEVFLINADPPARNLEWLPGCDDVHLFDGGIAQREAIAQADVMAVVDTNVADRLGSLADAVRHAGARKLLIDHHPGSESWFDHSYVRETASSTGQLIFELIEDRHLDLLDEDLATNLYVAITTDTGSFRYSHMSAEVHRVAAALIERGGLTPETIHQRLYDTRTLSSLRLLSAALGTTTLRFDGRLGYMVIPRDMLQESGADRDDTEGLVNYVLSIDGVEVALLFFETEAGTKISFRSRGNVVVHEWARSLGGGGHHLAAGAFVRTDVDEAIETVVPQAERLYGWDAKGGDSDDLSPEDQSYLSLMEVKAKDVR
jgi:phosphoesterase RecJ-like protein